MTMANPDSFVMDCSLDEWFSGLHAAWRGSPCFQHEESQ